MDKALKQSLTAQDKWLRLLFMVFFFIINYFVQMVVGFIALVQFIFTLFRGAPNERVVTFGDSLSQFIFQMMAYLTYATEEKPFPFSEWPAAIHHVNGHAHKASKKNKDTKNSEE